MLIGKYRFLVCFPESNNVLSARAKPWFFCATRKVREAMRLTGRVKWFDNKLGYGFIKQDSGEEIFVHYSKIRGDGYRSLKEGQKVEFEVIKSPEGRMQAGEVEVVAVTV
jgi:CspA family cold shock protein